MRDFAFYCRYESMIDCYRPFIRGIVEHISVNKEAVFAILTTL